MRKKLKVKILLVAALFVCAILTVSCSSKKGYLENDTMLWMDAYITIAESEENMIDLYYYYKPDNAQFTAEDIKTITFVGLEKELIVDGFSIEEKEPHEDDLYHSYCIRLTYHFEAQGEFSAEKISIKKNKGKAVEYPIGDWAFSVGEASAKTLITANNAPIATLDNRQLPCSYKIESGYTLGEIQFSLYDTQKVEQEGIYQQILVLNELDAPIYYVQPKLTVNKDGKSSIQYVDGCYCGLLSITQDKVELSRIHFKTLKETKK